MSLNSAYEYPHGAGSTAGGLYLMYVNARFLYRIRSRRLKRALSSRETKRRLPSIHLFGDDFFVGARCVVSLSTTQCEEESGSGRTQCDRGCLRDGGADVARLLVRYLSSNGVDDKPAEMGREGDD